MNISESYINYTRTEVEKGGGARGGFCKTQLPFPVQFMKTLAIHLVNENRMTDSVGRCPLTTLYPWTFKWSFRNDARYQGDHAYCVCEFKQELQQSCNLLR